MFDLTSISKKFRGGTDEEDVFEDGEKIRFICQPNKYGAYPPPTPAFKELPDWFENIPRENEHGKTAKSCQSLYDATSRGWIIKTPVEMEVRVSPRDNNFSIRKKENSRWLSTESNHINQLGDFPNGENLVLFQFRVPWAAETPPGYSTLVLPPLNHLDPRFRTFAGIIDTDNYPRLLNSVCMWTMPGYQGVIERGTPIATVLPVKRDDFGATATVGPASEEDSDRREAMETLVSDTHIDKGYQKEVWEPKPTQETTYEGDFYEI